jgi:hypothetical protein
MMRRQAETVPSRLGQIGSRRSCMSMTTATKQDELIDVLSVSVLSDY